MRRVCSFLFFTVFVSSVQAADLNIGLGADVTTMDPHYANISSNNTVLRHIFDSLVEFDNQRALQPALAESWKLIDDNTWEIRLRHGVKFHDGSEMTAEDVAYSLDRPATLANSPTPYTLYTKGIVEKQLIDKYTLRLKTAEPNAIMLSDLTNIFILSKKLTARLTTEDFNAGKGMIGTGPYKFVQFKRGDRIDLLKNENFWGKKASWDKSWERVSLRIITTPAARVAAVLAGDVQLIDNVPPADIAKLKGNPDLNIVSTLSSRVIFLELDQHRDNSPYVTDKAGKPLGKNPFKDYRVRLAISKAINRAAIADKVMEGNALPAGQLIPPDFWAAASGLKAETADLDSAKKLLTEAGYAEGFGLTLHGTNDRYVNDGKILQTIAQMLTRAGIITRVDAMPATVFFSRRARQEFSADMAGWGGGTGHPYSYLKALVASYDAPAGYGVNNNGRYSNSKMDALVKQAFITIDLNKQKEYWQQAMKISMSELAVIPLHYQMNVWALRKGFVYVPRTDEATFAYEVKS